MEEGESNDFKGCIYIHKVSFESREDRISSASLVRGYCSSDGQESQAAIMDALDVTRLKEGEMNLGVSGS